tara:strand:- start:857 stop:1417 length:561 start_codon:yes stop_codon:yes gene_type:complete
MARLIKGDKSQVPQGQEKAFDEIVENLGAVPEFGPGSILIHVPELSKRATALNRYLRYESAVPKKIQEFTMILTARHMDCQYIWNAHAQSAIEAGVSETIVEAVREETELPPLEDDERALVNYCRAINNSHYASRGEYQAMLEQFGEQAFIEITMIIGNYTMLALAINTFESDLPPNRTQEILPVW